MIRVVQRLATGSPALDSSIIGLLTKHHGRIVSAVDKNEEGCGNAYCGQHNAFAVAFGYNFPESQVSDCQSQQRVDFVSTGYGLRQPIIGAKYRHQCCQQDHENEH